MSEPQEKQTYFVHKPPNAYVVDAESTAEMGRLMRLDEILTECMGGLFPEHPDLAAVKDTLDVACGPGAWACELAYHYPEMQVRGIDISQTMIDYARAQAKVQGLENAHFQVMDATKPLAFPDNTFDLVNARGQFGFMPKEVWPAAVREFVRVARPGGIIRLTEPDSLGSSNSFALEKYVSLFTRAYFVTGRSFSPFPEAQHFGLTFMLGSFLQAAGCQDIQQKAYVVDFSAGARAYFSNYQNYKVGFKLLQPFLVQAGVATQEELDALYEQLLAEMLSDNFRAVYYILSIWGCKP